MILAASHKIPGQSYSGLRPVDLREDDYKLSRSALGTFLSSDRA